MGWFDHREGNNSPQQGDALLVVDFETSGFSEVVDYLQATLSDCEAGVIRLFVDGQRRTATAEDRSLLARQLCRRG